MIESEKNIGQPTVELTNMVMIEDKKSGKVLVQERIKSWRGVSFPGGHIEPGESFVDSAVREVKKRGLISAIFAFAAWFIGRTERIITDILFFYIKQAIIRAVLLIQPTRAGSSG